MIFCIPKTKRIAALAASILLSLALSGCSFFSKLFTPAPSDDVLPHLIGEQQAETHPVRPVTGFAGEAAAVTGEDAAEQTDALIALLQARRKPDLSGCDERVITLYDTALQILNRYIRNDFTALERVHAIHDYLAYYVTYDQALFDRQLAGEAIDGKDESFWATGALLNKRAVCDGYAKALGLLCGIEGIPAVRVTGEYNDGGSSVLHAWNQVSLDGGTTWHNVDVTMDAFRYTSGGGEIKAVLNHGYFLISNEAITDAVCGRHTFSGDDEAYFSAVDYPSVYADMPLFTADGKTYRMEVTSQQELNDIFAHVKAQRRKIGKLELKLRFTGYDPDDLRFANAYANELKQAYGKVSDSDFIFDTAKKMYPYQRYPHGVYVLLIYK